MVVKNNVKKLRNNIIYNIVFVTIALVVWFLYIRKQRSDKFRPNAKIKTYDDLRSVNDEDPKQIEKNWFKKLYRWPINESENMDIYFYLLFHKLTAIQFYIISFLSFLIGLNMIYTAKPAQSILDNGEIIQRSFLERVIITNIPAQNLSRIWSIYFLALLILFISLYVIVTYYLSIKIKKSGCLQQVKNNDEHAEQKIFPSDYTIMIKNIDFALAAPDKIFHSLINIYSREDILKINLIMNYSYILTAYDVYSKKLKKFHKLQKKLLYFKFSLSKSASIDRLQNPIVDEYEKSGFDNQKNANEEMSVVRSNTVVFLKTLEYSRSCHIDLSVQKKENLKMENDIKDNQKMPLIFKNKLSTVWDNIKNSDQSIITQYSNNFETIDEKNFSVKELRKLHKLLEQYKHAEREWYQSYFKLQKKREIPPFNNVGIAFVTFSSKAACRFAIKNDFSTDKVPIFKKIFFENTSSCKWNPAWTIQQAPAPEDILWENVHYTKAQRFLRVVLSNFWVFIILLTLTSTTLIVDMILPLLTTIESAMNIFHSANFSLTGWLIPNILYLINFMLLPYLVLVAAEFSKYLRRSSRDKAVLISNVNYLMLNTLVLPLLGVNSINMLLYKLCSLDFKTIISNIGLDSASASENFILRYVVNTTFINTAMQLLQIPMFLDYVIQKNLKKNPIKWHFDFGFWYAFHLSWYAIFLCFSIDCPFIPLIGAVFFTLKFWVDKYNMTMGVWSNDKDTGGAPAKSTISFMLAFQSLALFLKTSYFVTIILANTNGESNNYAFSLNFFTGATLFMAALSGFILLIAIAEYTQRTICVKRPNIAYKFLTFVYKPFKKKEVFDDTERYNEIEKLSEENKNILIEAYRHPLEKN